jgi:hypothetical protein
MTATVTLSQGTRSVTIPLVEESGTNLLASDLGKPEVQLPDSGGAIFPRALDNFSGLENITLQGRFTSPSAYDDARALVDLLQSGQGDTPILFNTSLPEYDSDINVVLSAGSDTALTVTYDAGKKNDVGVQASLTRVGNVNGIDTRQPSTPTATGSGPIQIKAGGQTVDIGTGISVERSTGRPNDVVRRQPRVDFPRHVSKRKTIAESFSLAFEFTENPVSKLSTITQEIFRTRQGRTPIYLDFQGVYGLGEFAVMPTGSAPFRQVRAAGYEGWVRVPTLDLVRVFDPTA